MIPKPPECQGCTLFNKGNGFARPWGNSQSSLVVIAEALGKNEALQGVPLVGEAGVYWGRALGRLGVKRESLLIGNTVNCQPPNNWLSNAPWEHQAIHHCHVHRKNLYQGPGKTFLTMGVIATRTVLKEVLNVDYSGELENWHGYVIGPPEGPWVIPTYHPSYVLQDNHDLFGCLLFDIKRAMEVASFGPPPKEQVDLVVDPPPAWFFDYVEQIPDDPAAWVAVDLETADVTPSSRITRFNLSMHPNQGVTVPNEERYAFGIRKALASMSTKLFWNERFDLDRLSRFSYRVNGETLDGMWAWHMLQSALPKGLGFVAPFYSSLPPWKHLSLTEPGPYAATDAVQTLRIMLGLKKDLEKSGQWPSFLRYATALDHQAIYPMEREGIGVDTEILKSMQVMLSASIQDIAKAIETMVPPEAFPWEGGWKRQPLAYPDAFLGTVKERVIVCRRCFAKDITASHKCVPNAGANDSANH